ncbi:MAG: S9 family peptidase [Gammaproteobacteria bacterium]|nr:S9 family peptidase [Gammaproteobacteria bacterium]
MSAPTNAPCNVQRMKYGLYAMTTLLALSAAAQVPANVETRGVPEVPQEVVESLFRYQNARSAGLVNWFRDGILISTRFGDTSQLHYVEQPLGARRQLTFKKEPVGGAIVSPTGEDEGFIFTMDTGGSEFYQIFHYDFDTGDITLLSDGKSRYTGIQFTHDGSGIGYTTTERNGTDWDLHIRQFDGSKRILQEDQGIGWSIDDFSPTGDRALISQCISNTETKLYEIDLKSLKRKRLLEDKGQISIGTTKYDAAGSNIYFTSDMDSDYRAIWTLNLESGATENIVSNLNWDVSFFRFSQSRNKMAYVVNEAGYSSLFLLDLDSQQSKEITPSELGHVYGIRFSKDEQQLGFSYQTPVSNTDVYALNLEDNTLTRWTQSELGELRTEQFVRPELVKYTSFDELKIPAFVFEPRGDGPHPVLVYIHGGPASQYRPGFSPTFQYYVNELGLAVIAPNVRGSRGYGKHYMTLDDWRLREDSVRDIGALLDWIETQPQLDSSRVAVIGGSYGGYMVLASLVHYNDRLKVGIETVGISNFVSFLERTQGYRRDLRRAEYGDERDPGMRAFLESIAPLNHVDKIKAPLLIGQGLNDPRVPAYESEQIAAAVSKTGVPTWYVLAKDEGHGFRKKDNRDYWSQTVVYFLQKHLLSD